MTAVIVGQVSGGMGKAHINCEAMIDAVKADFPQITNSKYGTINVDKLVPSLSRSYADFWTPQKFWSPVADLGQPGQQRLEAFGFIKVKFEYPLGGDVYDSWIILPEGNLCSYDDNRWVEIISDNQIPGVKREAPCAIHLDHAPSLPRPNFFGQIYQQKYVPKPGARDWLVVQLRNDKK